MSNPSKQSVSLREIFLTFLTIGATAFGGGMAIVAYIQELVVSRKKWLSLEEFSHGVAFGQILGPFSVNTAVFVGYRLRGLPGAVLALTGFMAPSVVVVIILSWLYFQFHHIPALQSALKGIGPVIVALMVSASYDMGQKSIRSVETGLIALASLVLLLFAHLQTVLVLLLVVLYGVVRLRMSAREAHHEA